MVSLALFACGGDGDARSPGETATEGDGGTAEGDGGTADDDGGTADDDDGGATAFDPGAAVLPRLTAQQYRNSLEHLLGPDLPATTVEADTNPYLFYSIGATSTTLSELGTQMYEEAADLGTHHVFGDPTRRLAVVGCEPTAVGDACVQDFVHAFGRRAYRRPLTDEEHARWLAVASAADVPDAWEGLRLVVAGMLQSPYFLYRVELGEPDPEDPSRLRYTDFEMASRLSFLLWSSTPDDALLDAAEAGELGDAAGVVAHAERLLADPRARVAVQDFFAQYFDLGRLSGLSRDPAAYPAYSETIAGSMRTEVQLVVDDFVFRRDADLRGVFGTRETFVNDELAALYGVDAPGASPIAYVPVELPESGPRAGLLTLGAFLAMNAHETETSPTLRGKYVRERVLCEEVPPPPDDVDTQVEPADMEGKTLRERLEEHRTNPVCAGCHAFIDPPGFLFEHFDSIGAYRTEDNGWPIDASGDLDGMPLADARDLAEALKEEPRVGTCVVTQLLRHAHGRLETESEESIIEDLDARFEDEGYRFRALLLHVVSHDGFRHLAPAEGGGA
jgi:hypothetical protein